MDNFYRAHRFLGAGIGEQLHNGRVYSHPSGACSGHRTGQDHSRPQNRVIFPKGFNAIKFRKGLAI